MERRIITGKAVLLIAIFYLASCDRYPDPDTVNLKSYSFYFVNNQGQRYDAGTPLDVQLYSYSNSDPSVNGAEVRKDSIKIVFEILSGSGTITNNVTYTDANGQVMTQWTLGTQSCEQKLRAKAYDQSGKYLATTDLTEYGFTDNTWNKINVDPDGYFNDLATDTINKLTLMVNNNGIYKQGVHYYDWVAIANPLLSYLRTIDVDNNGVFYSSNYNGMMIKSVDHGTTWFSCAKPYPDVSNILTVTITSDNYIWVYTYDQNVKFSRDGGQSWKEVKTGMGNGVGDIFRMKDGSILYHGSDCCSLYRSTDEMLTWNKVITPGNSFKVFVDKNDKITLFTNGVIIYNSVDYGATFTQAYAKTPYYNQWMDNTITHWGKNYYVVISNWGLLVSHDLTSYHDYWINGDIRSIFTDYNGVQIAKDISGYTYYMRNTGK